MKKKVCLLNQINEKKLITCAFLRVYDLSVLKQQGR